MEKLFVGTTLLLAAFDGGLSALLVGTALAGGTYVVCSNTLGSTSQKICDAAEETLQAKVDAISDPKKKKIAEAVMARKLKEIKKRREDDDWGAEEVAKIIALGTFAFPPAALGVAAHLIRKNSK